MRDGLLSRMWLTGERVCRDACNVLDVGGDALERHQTAAVDWLCRAQDATCDGGVSAGFHLKDGWLPSYPETTGYIVCTFFDQADERFRPELEERAWRMIEWLLTRQLDSGAFPGQFGRRSRGPVVFNTGQVLLGLVRASERERSRQEICDAAVRAAGWLRETMDSDGVWRRHTHEGVIHSYNARTAFAMLRCWQLCGDPGLREAALGNLYWVLASQDPDGFIRHAGFRADQPAHLHTIAYAIRGLLEGGLILEREDLIESASHAAEALASRMIEQRSLAGAYDVGWRPAGRYRCLTGEAQMAIIWAKLFERSGDDRMIEACRSALRFIAATQTLDGCAAVRGASAGSYPIWGRYSRFGSPNWAAKFFVDAVSAYQRADTSRVDSEAVSCV